MKCKYCEGPITNPYPGKDACDECYEIIDRIKVMSNVTIGRILIKFAPQFREWFSRQPL
jgi:hypothetical protein